MALCLSNEEFVEVLDYLEVKSNKRNFYLVNDGIAALHTFHSDKNPNDVTCIMCIDDSRIRTLFDLYGVIIHESVHAVQSLLDSLSEEKPGDEIHAYYIEDISQRFIEEYHRKRKIPIGKLHGSKTKAAKKK